MLKCTSLTATVVRKTVWHPLAQLLVSCPVRRYVTLPQGLLHSICIQLLEPWSHCSLLQIAGDTDSHAKLRSATHKRRDSLDSDLVSSRSMPSAALDGTYAAVEADGGDSIHFG